MLGRDLAARLKLELDAIALEPGAKLSHSALHRISRRRVVLADVPRRGNGGDPICHGGACDLQRAGEVGGPVVEPRQDARVEIDHVISARNSAHETVCLR